MRTIILSLTLGFSLFLSDCIAGKIVVYKVDTDKEQALAQSMGISSLPTLLFIPVKGQPQASMGAVPRETFVKAINDILLVN